MPHDQKLTPEQIAEARQRRIEAMQLQEIEGNPLDDADVALFEMFERERWNHERCRAYIVARAAGQVGPTAAE